MATAKNQTVGRMSPRQKMINLMYIVLTAMLALNVSSEVMNGFTQVQSGLLRSNRTITARNQAMLEQIAAFNNKFPKQGKQWLDLSTEVCSQTDSLYNYIDALKLEIVRKADGPDGDVNNIVNQDNLDAASEVMTKATGGKGKILREKIDKYRNYILSIIDDPQKRESVRAALSTDPYKAPGIAANQKWEESMFENMPTIAAVTLLTKLQNDLRFAEGEALSTMLNNLDTGELRVNHLEAFVVPQSRMVMRGTKYSANIVIAAIDTMQRPRVYVNGHLLGNNRGLYEVTASQSGKFDYSGFIEVIGRDGSVTKRDFKSSYTVFDPLATISAMMMNVLYAGIDNPISIGVPGVPSSAISATMTNGSLVKSGDHWVARPGKVGTNCEITVTAEIDGTRTNVGSTTFRVRKLPDPMPFITYKDANGQSARYKGGRPFSKGLLLAAGGLDAAIDDDMLNIDYRVVSFETVFFDSMGNAIPEVSAGASFSERQKTAIRRLQHGKRFYISRVKATGPDGITRDIAPMEVIVN